MQRPAVVRILYHIEQHKLVAALAYLGLCVVVIAPLLLALSNIKSNIKSDINGNTSNATWSGKASALSAARPSMASVASIAVPALSTTAAFPRAGTARVAPAPTASLPASHVMVWPNHGVVTTQFSSSHHGMDIASFKPVGSDTIVAFRAGTVIKTISSDNSGYGQYIIIDHGNGLTSLYGHLSAFRVQVGQTVAASDPIGVEGSTGHSTGPHLHFEIRENNVGVNPHNYLPDNP